MLNIEDHTQLTHYLACSGLIEDGEDVLCQRLAGGVSCTTVLVKRPNDKDFVIKQALPRLRVASNWTSNPKRSHREAQGIRYLRQLLPGICVPDLFFEDIENHVLAMAAVPQPHDNWKYLLLSGVLVADHARQFGQLLGSIHAKAFEQSAAIEPVFRDYSFFETLRLEPYYTFTQHQIPAAASFLGTLISETRKHRITLVHGDYSPKNILIYQNNLVLLDHETIHWGDPMFDLGFSLTHFLSKANHDPQRRSEYIQLSHIYWNSYCEHVKGSFWDDACELRAVKHTLACLLARVNGRSPLEYLDQTEQERQRRVVLELMNNPGLSVPQLTDSFVKQL